MVAGMARSDRAGRPVEKYVTAQAGGFDDGGPNVAPPMTEFETDFLREFNLRVLPEQEGGAHLLFHRQWWMNISYYAGQQWAEWTQAGLLETPRAPSWRKRYTANRIFPMVMRQHAKLVSEQVQLRVGPNSPEREDIQAAKSSEDLLDWLKYVSNYEQKREDALLWATTCGTGFVKILWNPQAGPEVVQIDEATGTKKIIKAGEIECDVSSPFAIRVPQFVVDHEKLPWISEHTILPIEYVQERWSEKGKYVVPDLTENGDDFIEQRVATLIGMRGSSMALDSEASQRFVRVKKLWTLPFKGHPNGICGVVANNVVLEAQDENPYISLGIGLPFVKFDYARIPGRYWGMSMVEQLIPPQREYNITRSQIIENKNLMTRPKWKAPKGHGIPKGGMNDAPGEVIEYNPALPAPEPIVMAPLPSYVSEHAMQALQEMNDIAAQQDVSQAKAPASVRSGIAVQLLQQADVQALAIPKLRLFRSDRRAAEIMLILATKMYQEKRLVQILGSNSQFDVKELMGSDLRGHTTVRIFAESGILDTKAARQQTIMDFVQTGILNPQDPQEKKSILEAVDQGDIRSYVLDSLMDEKRAEFENDLFLRKQAEGGAVQLHANDFDDHEVHIRKHNNVRKDPSFLLEDPSVQQALAAHVLEHMNYMQLALQQEMAQNQSEKGKPGEKGKPSPPNSGPSGQASPKESTGGQS